MASRTTTDPIEILLEVGIDLDNLSGEEDYLSALMEAVAIIELLTKGKGDSRSAILRKEVIRVRKSRKERDKNFKARKTTVSADSFKKGTATTSKVGQRALPPAIKPKTSIIPYQKSDEVDEEEAGGKKKKARTRKKKDKDQNLLEGIAKSVNNIASILKDQYGLKKKKAAYDRKKAESDRRKLKESALEKRFKGLASTAEKIIKPVKGVLDRILDFFLNIIIGRFLVKFFKWFSDPKNAKKVNSVIRFLSDHGPKLLAAFLLFGTGIGRFAVRLSALLLKGALRLGAAAAKFAFRFAMRNPAAAAITAIVGGAALGAISQANTQSNDPDAPEGRTQLEDTMDYGGVTGDPVAGAFQYGGTIPYYNDGGGVGSGKITTNSGSDITGAGPDTQLIAAQPGEIVINKRTVDAVGADHFLGLNRQYGGAGANKPKTATVQTASGGGFVLPTFNNGGQVVGSGDESNNRPRGIDSELFAGFGGRTSQSDNYSVRVINEIAKKVYNMINADRGGSPPPPSGRRTPPSAPPSSGGRTPPPSSGSNIPGAGIAEEVYNRGKDFIGGVYDSVKPKIDAAMPKIQALPSTIDYGSLYLKSQLGGVGGAITEADLSQSTKDEYTRAYQVALTKLPQRRAGVESVIRQQQRILSNPGATEEQKKNAKRTLAVNKSRLAKYDAGQVDVQYEDFKVDGKLTPTAAAAQKTMGAVWASDTGDGGFKIEKEPYDFPIVKDPIGLMNWKNLSEKEKLAWLDKQEPNLSVRKKLDPRPPYKGSLGKWGKQDIAEAMYSLNPAAAPMVTDVKIGGNTRPEAIADAVLNTVESVPLLGTGIAFARGLGMNLLFGKTRDVTKGPIEGAASDSIFRKLFPKQDKKEDSKATNIADQSGGLGSPDPVEKPKLTASQIKNNQAYAASKGKYYSSTTNKTYANYAAALKDPAVAAGAEKMQQKKDSAMAMIMGGKDAYYSSTTGRYYKNYAEALKDPKVAAAAEVEKTKASLSLPKPSMTMPGPPPGGGDNVKVVRLPSSNSKDTNQQSTGGSEVNAAPTGNGNKAKWNILGIPMPF